MRALALFWMMLLLAASAWPQSAAEWFRRGNDSLSKGDYPHAIEAYTESLRLDPRSADALSARGYAYYHNHDDDRAIRDFTEAIRLEPQFADAFRGRAITYEDKNDYAAAIQDYTKAIRLKPADITLLYDRAFNYEREDKYELAIADFTKIIQHFPQAADAYRDRGQARIYSGHLPEAQQDLSKAVELIPTGYYNVIWLYIAQARGKVPEAEDELQKNAAKLDLTRWPGPVVQLFLGQGTPDAVLRAASDRATSDNDPRKNSEQQCEARFYIAEYQALHGERAVAREGFRAAARSCDEKYFMYVPAARAELAGWKQSKGNSFSPLIHVDKR